MVTHVGNVNLSVIYRIWLTKCTFFGLVIRIRSSLFIIRRIRSPSPGLPGSACHPASPYSCPCRRTVGPAGSAGCLVQSGPGSGSDSRASSCEETKMPQALSINTNRYRIRIPKRTRRPLATSPSAYFSDRMDQFETICDPDHFFGESGSLESCDHS